MERRLFAFMVTSEMDGRQYTHAVEGANMADAAAAALARLPRRVGPSAEAVRIELLDELLGGVPGGVAEPAAATAAVEAPRPQAAVASPTAQPAEARRPTGTTLMDRLMDLLRERGGTVHVAEVAAALGTSRKALDKVVARAVRAGVACRDAGRTGRFKLVGAEEQDRAEGAAVPAAPRAAAGARSLAPSTGEASAAGQVRPSTRLDRMIALLRSRGGRLHVSEVAKGLGIKRKNADNVVAAATKAGLATRAPGKSGVVILAGPPAVAASVPAALPRKPETTPAPAASAGEPEGRTRVEQLLALLRERGRPVHVSEIATALRTPVGNVNNIVASGARAGVLARVGGGTGLVELIPAGRRPAAPAAPPAASAVPGGGTGEPRRADAGVAAKGPSRATQLVALLERHGGALRVAEIAVGLGTTVGSAKMAVVRAVQAGQVRRIGGGSGLIALAQASSRGPAAPAAPDIVPEAPADAPPPVRELPAAPPVAAGAPKATAQAAKVEVPPETLAAWAMGIPGRVHAVLVGQTDWIPAKGIAEQLGCRPREVGNALALLVKVGVVERRDGDKAADQPATYRAVAPADG